MNLFIDSSSSRFWIADFFLIPFAGQAEASCAGLQLKSPHYLQHHLHRLWLLHVNEQTAVKWPQLALYTQMVEHLKIQTQHYKSSQTCWDQKQS